MSSVFSLLPLAFTFILYGLLVKLATKLYRGSQMSWQDAFSFGALAMLVGALGASLNFATGFLLSPKLSVILGVALQVALGGWFLGPRVIASSGEAVGSRGGAIVAAIAFAIAFALGVVAAVLVPVLSRNG